jgi:hypothetical protein
MHPRKLSIDTIYDAKNKKDMMTTIRTVVVEYTRALETGPVLDSSFMTSRTKPMNQGMVIIRERPMVDKMLYKEFL